MQAEDKGAKASTLLPLRKYFFVPGQRFRELYYWDTYWVVRGLLISGMLDSAKVRAHMYSPCYKWQTWPQFRSIVCLNQHVRSIALLPASAHDRDTVRR